MLPGVRGLKTGCKVHRAHSIYEKGLGSAFSEQTGGPAWPPLYVEERKGKGLIKPAFSRQRRACLETERLPLNIHGKEPTRPRAGTVSQGRLAGPRAASQRAARPELEPSRTALSAWEGGPGGRGQGRGSPLGTSGRRIPPSGRTPGLRTCGWHPGSRLETCGLVCDLTQKAGSRGRTDSFEADVTLPGAARGPHPLQGHCRTSTCLPRTCACVPAQKGEWRSVLGVRVPGALAKPARSAPTFQPHPPSSQGR